MGLGVCDQDLARILVEESGEAFQDLVSYGLAFRKDESGDYIREKGCFSEHKRAFLTDSLANIRSSFQSAFSASGAKTVVGRAVRLLVADNACYGALVVARDGTSVEIRSRATVLATGGGAALFEEHSVGEAQTGDGIALAIDAGAKIVNMEFIQFMLGLKSGAEKRFLPRRKLQERAVLTDCEGRDLPEREIEDEKLRARALKERLGHAPFSSRDASCLVDRSIARANRNGGAFFNDGNGDGNGGKKREDPDLECRPPGARVQRRRQDRRIGPIVGAGALCGRGSGRGSSRSGPYRRVHDDGHPGFREKGGILRFETG